MTPEELSAIEARALRLRSMNTSLKKMGSISNARYVGSLVAEVQRLRANKDASRMVRIEWTWISLRGGLR